MIQTGQNVLDKKCLIFPYCFEIDSETALQYSSTVEPLWKGQESLTKVAKFGQFQCNILYKSCLFYPS